MQEQNLSFYNLGIAPKMLRVLEDLKFESPTPVQHSAIPLAIEGQDLVTVAQTGTGKTLAFGIPMVQLLLESDTQALVLAPTRDLVLQVEEVFNTILRPFKMKSVSLIGGAPMFRQTQKLRKNPKVIIATAGRLIDHLERKTVKLDKISYLVLDEADRMFDMGFAPQVHRILEHVPKKRQTLLFSATMPASVVELATKYMKMPTHVEIAPPPGDDDKNITQELFIIKEDKKKSLLLSLLEKYRGSVILFIRTKVKTKRVAKFLKENKHKVIEIHSDRTMGQRKQAIEGFKSGRYRVLVATDVAARGIDIKNIELVINFDLPDDIENYIHRIGRTGRAGQKGHAITFAEPNQGRNIQDIEKMIKKSIPKGTHEGIETEEFKDRRRSKSSGKGKKSNSRSSFRSKFKVKGVKTSDKKFRKGPSKNKDRSFKEKSGNRFESNGSSYKPDRKFKRNSSKNKDRSFKEKSGNRFESNGSSYKPDRKFKRNSSKNQSSGSRFKKSSSKIKSGNRFESNDSSYKPERKFKNKSKKSNSSSSFGFGRSNKRSKNSNFKSNSRSFGSPSGQKRRRSRKNG